MTHAVRNRGVKQAMVVRILVSNRGNQKDAEEFARDVQRIVHAHAAGEARHSGAVGGVRVPAHRDGRTSQDSEAVEGVHHIARRQPGLLVGRQRLALRPVDEAGVPVDGRLSRAGRRLQTGRLCANRLRSLHLRTRLTVGSHRLTIGSCWRIPGVDGRTGGCRSGAGVAPSRAGLDCWWSHASGSLWTGRIRQ